MMNVNANRRSQGARALLLMLLSLCALCLSFAQGQSEETGEIKVGNDYVIGVEDKLEIVTRNVEKASGTFLVRSDGIISIPLIGDIKVAGLKLYELKQVLEEKLAKEVRNPDVTINVVAMRKRPVYVMGSVNGPGTYDYKPQWRLAELIATAGGLSLPAERLKAVIFRNGGETQVIPLRDLFISVKPEANVYLAPEDVVNIQGDSTIRVHISGEIASPGMVTLIEGSTTAEAIAAAGGPGANAALAKAYVKRRGVEIPINLYQALAIGRDELNISLEDNDTIHIPRLVEQVFVTGQVKSPGTQPIPDGRELTLTEAISRAGGPASKAKLDGVTLIRRNAVTGEREVINIDYKKMASTPEGAMMMMQDGDVIFVAESGAPSGSTIGSTLGLLLWPLRLFGL